MDLHMIERRKWRREAVSPVIAVILMLAVTVVLAAVAWLMVSGLISKTDVMPTTISLVRKEAVDVSGERLINVAGVDNPYRFNFFSVILIRNNTFVDEASRMDPLNNVTKGNITFYDPNADGKLNQGDYFIVKVLPTTDYEIKIIWKQTGNQISNCEWFEG